MCRVQSWKILTNSSSIPVAFGGGGGDVLRTLLRKNDRGTFETANQTHEHKEVVIPILTNVKYWKGKCDVPMRKLPKSVRRLAWPKRGS